MPCLHLSDIPVLSTFIWGTGTQPCIFKADWYRNRLGVEFAFRRKNSNRGSRGVGHYAHVRSKAKGLLFDAAVSSIADARGTGVKMI